MGPFPLPVFDKSWSKLCQNSAVDTLETCRQRLGRLRLLTVEEVMKNSGQSTTLVPLADGTFLPTAWKAGDPHPATRCREIIIGNTLVEAIIFDVLAQALPQAVFHAKLLSAFPNSEDSARFKHLFDFDFEEEKEVSSAEAYRDSLRHFLSAVIFHYPSIRVAESFSSSSAPDAETKAYLYRFSTPSPYPGPSHNLPVHGQCSLFLFNNDQASWPPESCIVAKEMARLWTGFAHGVEPWEEFRVGDVIGGKVMGFGNGVFGVRGLEEEGEGEGWGREDGSLGWLREHFETAARFVLGLMG